MNELLHALTPRVTAFDARAQVVREMSWHRVRVEDAPMLRVTQQRFDAAGRMIASRDPRLGPESDLANLNIRYTLAGQALLTDSVDSGWQLRLPGEAGQLIGYWDGRGTRQQIEYDVLLRPLTITEQTRVVERFRYGGPDAFEHNQCNQLIRHDDPAGTRLFADYGVPGSALSDARRFLLVPEAPDWPVAEAERDALLEDIPLETRWSFNALGDVILQTDAMGHTQHFTQTVAGQWKAVGLTLNGATQSQTLVSDIHYNAFNQVEQETAGNGLISRSQYDPQDGRLMELHAALADKPTLQHLKYAYDPVGNILQIEDHAQPVRFFANQRVEPVNHYRYDTLYQLIEATGREANTGSSHGPTLPILQNLPPDPNQISNYTQHYDYDAAGNLLQMRHVGAQNFTRTMLVAANSNRSLPEDETDADFDTGFDANGNLLHLIRGQTLAWDLRNQLQQITTVTRATKASDHERYIYDGQGQRCRKINSALTSSRTLSNEVRYLPGLEIRTTADGEILHVITARNSRMLHWQAGQPSDIENNQIRYSLNDHLGSSTLELDQQGGLISQESYYPFGGTSWWAARSAVEAKHKTVRYSGKERDASGLYYYGFRYYAPWLQRWINPDPAGEVNGLNLFCFVANNPVRLIDDNGLTLLDALDLSAPKLTQEKRIDASLVRSPSVSERRRNFSAETRAILNVAEENTKHFNSLKKSQQQKLLKLERLTLTTLKTGVAHAGVTTQDNSLFLRGFMNYTGSLSPRNLFPGISLLPQKKTIPHLAHFVPRLTTQQPDTNVYRFFTETDIKEDEHYRITDMEVYMDAVKNAYSSGEQPLHPFMEKRIREHVENSNFIIPSKAGVPGMHAEVQALNRLLNEQAPTGQNIHKVLSESYVFTKRLTGTKAMLGKDFPACFNCSGIISPFVHVITGRVEETRNTRRRQTSKSF